MRAFLSSRTLLMCGVVAICVPIATPAAAQATSQAYDIPAQGLGKALQAFMRASDREVLFSNEIVSGKRTAGVRGRHSAAQALEILLRGTGLRVTTVASGALLISAASQASAEGNIASAAAESSTEIVVTAQKRPERLIDTPQSVSVVSAASLERSGATQFRDFADIIPSLTYSTTGAGQTQVTLRGVTAGFDLGPLVGIYVDDIPYGSSSAFANGSQYALDVGLFDINQIEVLRGPQGTLYGASTMGGLIKYVTKRPDTNNFGGQVRAGVADTRFGGISYNGSVVLNAPLAQDKAAVRASGFYSHDGGYIDNLGSGRKDVNRANIYGGRADLLFTPTDALTVRVTGYLQDVHRDGPATADFVRLTGIPVDGSLAQRRVYEEPFHQRFRLISGQFDYDLGRATLTSITSYQTMHVRRVIDITGQFLPILAARGRSYSAVGIEAIADTDKFTQEVRLASGNSRPLSWLIGGFYTHEKSLNYQNFLLRDLAGAASPNDVFLLSAPSTYEEVAGFANINYRVSEHFELGGGLRYAHNQQAFTRNASGFLTRPSPRRTAKDGVVTYLANASYHVARNVTAYLRYATGYRTGGPNFVAVDPVTGDTSGPDTFEADRIKSYEAGIKAQTADRTFAVDAAAYKIDWSNIQINSFFRGFGIITNVKDGATIRGGELALTARPSTELTLNGSFAYQDASINEAAPGLGARAGERLPNVPRITAALTADYIFGNSGIKPSFGGTLRHIGKRNASFDAAATGFPQYRLPDYVSVDLRAGAVFGPVEAQVFVRNLFDVRAQISADASRGPARVAISQPRTIGLNLTSRF